MACEQAKRIVGDAASRPEQDHRYGLMRHLQDVGRQRVLAGEEMQAAIDDAEFAALQPDQAVPVDVCGIRAVSSPSRPFSMTRRA
jgi:hypothetical protein